MSPEERKNESLSLHKKERRSEFRQQIDFKVARKMRAKGRKEQTLWRGFSMMGVVGWSVAIPTLLGLALGVYLDHHYPLRHSWTLLFLILGLFAGCINAWYWVSKEEQEIGKEESIKDE